MPSYATAPFDHAKADIILRSSDLVDFRVFKLFLSLASPFFETLFDIPQPMDTNEGEEIKEGLPVIPVTEDSKTLDIILRFCYPCTLAEDPKLEVFEEVVTVLEAAQKYSLTLIEKKARQAISNPTILEKAPLQCFAIARQGGLREETLLAAKYTLARPLIPLWFPEINLISAGDLLALLTYHRSCGEAVYALKKNLSWIKDHYRSEQAYAWLHGRHGNSYCNCPVSTEPRYAVFKPYTIKSLQWWEDFMEETFEALREEPCRSTLQARAEKTLKSVKTRGCQICSARVTDGMRDFTDFFARRIEEEVSRIKLRLQFDQFSHVEEKC